LQSAAAAAYDRAELRQRDEPSASDLDFVENDEDDPERKDHEDFAPPLKSDSSDEEEAESCSGADASEGDDADDATSSKQHHSDANSVEPNDNDTNSVVHGTEYDAKRVARRNTLDRKVLKKNNSSWQPSRST
jgi:hypothetical protein